ncbi:hypothetical protein [Sphingomonas sp. 7/4-4]|uniref:hypothetical protein n=1 Tax=Sphingomonas sp. 7/4-4 TaxID=3018446 RepID=UPI00300DD87C
MPGHLEREYHQQEQQQRARDRQQRLARAACRAGQAFGTISLVLEGNADMDEDHSQQGGPHIAGDGAGLLDAKADREADDERQRIGADQSQRQPYLGTSPRRGGERRSVRITVDR